MNNILPGFIDSLPVKEDFLRRIPLQRYGKVSEISAVVEMLASEEAYITGQNIRVVVELLGLYKIIIKN